MLFSWMGIIARLGHSCTETDLNLLFRNFIQFGLHFQFLMMIAALINCPQLTNNFGLLPGDKVPSITLRVLSVVAISCCDTSDLVLTSDVILKN